MAHATASGACCHSKPQCIAVVVAQGSLSVTGVATGLSQPITVSRGPWHCLAAATTSFVRTVAYREACCCSRGWSVACKLENDAPMSYRYNTWTEAGVSTHKPDSELCMTDTNNWHTGSCRTVHKYTHTQTLHTLHARLHRCVTSYELL